MSDTNQADDYATGDSDHPARDEWERAVNDFTDRDELDAHFNITPWGDPYIQVQSDGDVIATFETLWEFDDYVSLRREMKEMVSA